MTAVVFDQPILLDGGVVFDDPTKFLYIFKQEEESGGGKLRVVPTSGKLNKEQLAQIQREDEDLIAIVTTLGEIIL